MSLKEALPWDFHEHVPYTAHVVVALYMIFVTSFSFFGNGLVLVVFTRFKTLRTAGNVLLVNLTVSDLLMAITGYPLLIASSFHGQWRFPRWVCDMYGGTATAFGLMSINTLVFIALDRCLAIVHLDRNKHLSYRQVYGAVVFIWIYSAAWGLMPVLGWGRFAVEGFGTTCSIDYTSSQSPDRYLLLVMLLCDFILPLSVIVACYVWIFSAVAKDRDSFTPVVYYSVKGKPKDTARRRRLLPKWSPTEYKVAKTILIVTLVFCLSWAPYAVVTMVAQYSDIGHLSPVASMLPALFAKTSTVFNPILYSMFHPKIGPRIKKVVRTLLGIRCHCSMTNVYHGNRDSMQDTESRPWSSASITSSKRSSLIKQRRVLISRQSTENSSQTGPVRQHGSTVERCSSVERKQSPQHGSNVTSLEKEMEVPATETRNICTPSLSSSDSQDSSLHPCSPSLRDAPCDDVIQAEDNFKVFIRQSMRRRTFKAPSERREFRIGHHCKTSEGLLQEGGALTVLYIPHNMMTTSSFPPDDDMRGSMTSTSTGSGSRELTTSLDEDGSNSGSAGE